MTSVATPCVKICAIDPGSGLCAGCGRTLSQIAAWPTLSEPDRAAIMARLAERRSAEESRAEAGAAWT